MRLPGFDSDPFTLLQVALHERERERASPVGRTVVLVTRDGICITKQKPSRMGLVGLI